MLIVVQTREREGEQIVKALGQAYSENGLAPLDNPPFAMKPQRMGHPVLRTSVSGLGTRHPVDLVLLGGDDAAYGRSGG
jgi:hypothetical protein